MKIENNALCFSGLTFIMTPWSFNLSMNWGSSGEKE